MSDFDIDRIDESIRKNSCEFEEIQKNGNRDILRYFDRIQDKLFSYNNMLIVGYFTLIVLPQSRISPWWILFPIFNMLYLIWIEYKMMEKSRFEASIMSKTQSEINQYGKRINETNTKSLLTILITVIVTIIFVYQSIIQF